ncbi:hypothetical protein [Prosthecobacter sp.]|jgi:hypothetical protein|uniref:hypothetical protein n=1 Tax=Prosthecobacter sp. TaxID=1965333 RepID=UPI00378351B2
MKNNMNDTFILTRVDEVSAAISLLLGPSAEAAGAQRELETFRREADEIIGRRGMSSTVIAVVGSKNSGKSWLCRSLLLNTTARERIPCGSRREGDTDKLMWIGAQLPGELDFSCETSIPVPPENLFDLGRPYVLLDVPGHNEADEQRRQHALRSITLAPLRVAMFTWDTMGDESNDAFLREGDGATVLPVIVDHQYPRAENLSLPEITRLRERLQRCCPLSEVLPPVLIPGFEHRGDRAAAEEQAAMLARNAIREAMTTTAANPSAMLAARLGSLRQRLGTRLAPLITRLRKPLEDLEKAEERAAGEVLQRLVGSTEELERSVRFQMLWRIASSLHPVMFPFRGFMTMLALVSGAIDRLAFAMLGSMPSLALSAFQAVRNVRSLTTRGKSLDHELNARACTLISEELMPALNALHRAARHALPEGVTEHLRMAPGEIKVSGIEQLRSRSSKIFADSVASFTTRFPAFMIGAVATVIFWTLAAGPLWALYQSFLLAWRTSFEGMNTFQWQNFPVPSPGYVFGNLMMTMLPVMFLAFITCLVSTFAKRLTRCANEITSRHHELIAELTTRHQVFFATRDQVREALKTILHFVDTE